MSRFLRIWEVYAEIGSMSRFCLASLNQNKNAARHISRAAYHWKNGNKWQTKEGRDNNDLYENQAE
jgi:hypothetical protein